MATDMKICDMVVSRGSKCDVNNKILALSPWINLDLRSIRLQCYLHLTKLSLQMKSINTYFEMFSKPYNLTDQTTDNADQLINVSDHRQNLLKRHVNANILDKTVQLFSLIRSTNGHRQANRQVDQD